MGSMGVGSVSAVHPPKTETASASASVVATRRPIPDGSPRGRRTDGAGKAGRPKGPKGSRSRVRIVGQGELLRGYAGSQRPPDRMSRVLHIEDDPRNRLLVRKLLAADGHEVIDATDGLEGVRSALTLGPDLVLVDVHIPGLDGYEVTLRLRGEA